jgi:hypothetical protein
MLVGYWEKKIARLISMKRINRFMGRPYDSLVAA